MATTDIISSLFGIAPALDPRSAELQARQDALGLGSLFGAAGVNEYATPERQQAYMNKQAAQFALADFGVRKLGGLFGLQTPELKRASAIEGALSGLQDELTTEQIQDPTQLYPALIKRLQGAGMDKEALMVAAKAAPEIKDWQLNQAKIVSEQASAKKATTEKATDIERLYEFRQRAEAAGRPDIVAQIDAELTKRAYIPEKQAGLTEEPNRIAMEMFGVPFNKLTSTEQIAAVNKRIDEGKLAVSSVEGTGAYDTKGNYKAPSGEVIPKEQMIDVRNSQDASVQLLDRLSMLDEKDIDLAFGKIFDTTQQGVTSDMLRLGANEEVVGAQYKVNNIGVREVLKNLQDLKGASSDKEMSRVASTFPGFSADPKVMKEWVARAYFTTLRFTNQNKEKYGFEAPEVSVNEAVNNPMFKYLSESEKSKFVSQLIDLDSTMKQFSKEDKKVIVDDASGITKVINGVRYRKDKKGWKVEGKV